MAWLKQDWFKLSILIIVALAVREYFLYEADRFYLERKRAYINCLKDREILGQTACDTFYVEPFLSRRYKKDASFDYLP